MSLLVSAFAFNMVRNQPTAPSEGQGAPAVAGQASTATSQTSTAGVTANAVSSISTSGSSTQAAGDLKAGGDPSKVGFPWPVDDAILGPDLEAPVAQRAPKWNINVGAQGSVKVGGTTFRTEGR